VREVASHYEIALDNDLSECVFKQTCQEIVKKGRFISNWQCEIKDDTKHPILKTYKTIKTRFEFEPYLELIKNPKYRIAISKLRASSHPLEIERGRHTRPITPVENRVCPKCKYIDDELHFVLNCSINMFEKLQLFKKIHSINGEFADLTPENKFTFLLNSNNERIVKWLAIFVYRSFEKRKSIT